ncbi:MAG: trimeric autotransporter adhesin, partial [Clostridiales bacterium]|nr:trimeric autotransporter adhesin [Clostridiales bacterium]
NTSKQPVQLAVPVAKADKMVENLKSSAVEKATAVVTVNKEYLTDNDKAVVSEVITDKEILQALADVKKTLTIQVADEKGTIYYAWELDGAQLAKAGDVNENVNLAVAASSSKNDEAMTALINKDSKNKEGHILSLGIANGVPDGSSLTVNAGKQFGSKPSQTVYVYHVNRETNTLDSIAQVKHKVSEDGFIQMNVKYGDDYVVLDHPAAPQIKRTLTQQVSVSDSKLSIEKGSKDTLSVTLPEIIKVVKTYKEAKDMYGDEIMLAKVTYTTSSSRIATVAKDGTIKAKKAGVVTITTTVQLQNHTKKTFTTTVKVK